MIPQGSQTSYSNESEQVPITKEEVRAITIGKLRLKEGFTAIDVGCGSGSLTVEICNQIRSGTAYAIDFDEKAVELTKAEFKSI